MARNATASVETVNPDSSVPATVNPAIQGRIAKISEYLPSGDAMSDMAARVITDKGAILELRANLTDRQRATVGTVVRWFDSGMTADDIARLLVLAAEYYPRHLAGIKAGGTGYTAACPDASIYGVKRIAIKL